MIRTYRYRIKGSRCMNALVRHVRAVNHVGNFVMIRKSMRCIAVGNVNAAKLAKTKMAKSVLDAGWSALNDMLTVKAVAHGATVIQVNEAFSTVTCSCCARRTGPKG